MCCVSPTPQTKAADAAHAYALSIVGPLRQTHKAWRIWKGHTRHHTVAGRAVGRHVNKKARVAYVRWRELLFEGGVTALHRTGKLVLIKELLVLEEEAKKAHVHAQEGQPPCRHYTRTLRPALPY